MPPKSMFVSKPATVGAEVFERLHLFFMKEAPTPFDLRRLESDAARLDNSNRAEAYTVRAAIAALRWNLSDAKMWSEKACLASPSATTALNGSVTFRFLNALDDAVDYATRAVTKAPIDRTCVGNLAGVLAMAGRFRESASVIDEFNRKMASEPIEVAPKDFAVCLQRLGIEKQLQDEVRAAMTVLSQERIRFKEVQFEHDNEPDGSETIVASVSFAGDFATEMRLESKLAHKLAELPGWNPNRLSVEFAHCTPEDVHQAA